MYFPFNNPVWERLRNKQKKKIFSMLVFFMRWDWVYVRMNLEKRKMFFRMRQVSGRIESQIGRGLCFWMEKLCRN